MAFEQFQDAIEKWDSEPIWEHTIHVLWEQIPSMADIINAHTLVLHIKDLINLSEEEIFTLTGKIAQKIKRAASKEKCIPDESQKHFWQSGEMNAIVHELDHARKALEFYPDKLDFAHIRIFLVREQTRKVIRTIMGVRYAIPAEGFTSMQNLEILLAPKFPSQADYEEIWVRCFENKNLTQSEILHMISLIEAKPRSRFKEVLLGRVKRLLES